MRDRVTVDRKLWLTAGRDRLVEDGDPDAAFLFAAPGDEVDAEDLQRLQPAPVSKPAGKAKAKPADKQMTPAEEKAADAPVDGEE